MFQGASPRLVRSVEPPKKVCNALGVLYQPWWKEPARKLHAIVLALYGARLECMRKGDAVGIADPRTLARKMDDDDLARFRPVEDLG